MNKYRHTCIISSFNGFENGVPSYTEKYSGICNYQESNSVMVAGNIVVHKPKVFLPENTAVIDIGDNVLITIENNRQIKAEVDNVKDRIGTYVKGTRIELKQAT